MIHVIHNYLPRYPNSRRKCRYTAQAMRRIVEGCVPLHSTGDGGHSRWMCAATQVVTSTDAHRPSFVPLAKQASLQQEFHCTIQGSPHVLHTVNILHNLHIVQVICGSALQFRHKRVITDKSSKIYIYIHIHTYILT